MREDREDITRSVFCSNDINKKIATLFPDAAVLDIQFNIISISQNILDATGYLMSDVQGKSISTLSFVYDFKSILEDQLLTGYFEEQSFEVRCKNGEKLRYSVSGFYMGLIADINGLIVLKFKDSSKEELINEELVAKTHELDEFIYSSSHSLRGPLATLKGLIHLLGLTKDPKEIEFLVKQMNVFAEKLDQKLHQLIYVAESDKNPVEQERLSILFIFQSLSFTIQEASIDFPVNFYNAVSDSNQVIEMGEGILSILNNLALFFCQQPKTPQNLLVFDILSNSSAIEIMFRSKGFLFSESLIEKIKSINFKYSEILNFPEMTNYYAAKKIIYKMNGNIQFMLISSDEIVVLMTVPIDNKLLVFDSPSNQSMTPSNH